MKTAFICVCSEKYLPNYKILYQSFVKSIGDDADIILYYGGHTNPTDIGMVINFSETINKTGYSNELYKYCAARPTAILNAFEQGYDNVVLMGADTEFFSYPYEVFSSLQDNDAFVTMYIHEPYEGDQNLFGNNLQVLENGQINADFIGFRKNKQTIKFIKWVEEQTATKCTINGKEYVDQVFFSMAFSFLEHVKVIRHQGYNVAHYNMFQRGMRKLLNGNWSLMNYQPLVLFHYAGLVKGQEEKISRHQNRYKAEGDILEFLKQYTSKL